MPLKLNGWQRLWVVLSILYLIVVISVDFMIWPKTTYIEKSRLNEVYELIHKAEGKEEKYKYTDIVDELNRRGLLASPNNEKEELMAEERWAKLADLAILKYKDKIDFSQIESRYKSDLRELNSERKQTIFLSFLFWLVPVIVAYTLGLAARWIMRGFREKSKA